MRVLKTKPIARFTVTGCLAIGMLLAMVTFAVDAASLYKWIDENGQVRYSDRLPAEQIKKKHQQLNKQGVVLSTTEDARSEEEIAAEIEQKKALEKQRAEEARIKAIQDEKDKVLLLTFSSEEELLLARNNRIEVLSSVISLIEKSIESTQQKLDELIESAENVYLSQGKEVPGGLAQKIEHFTRKVESRNEQLRLKQEEKSKIDQQYEIDLARYRHLKSQDN